VDVADFNTGIDHAEECRRRIKPILVRAVGPPYHPVMPRATSADLYEPLAFPTELGPAVWRERRTYPLASLVGVPATFLAVLAVVTSAPALRVLFGAAFLALVVVTWRRRDRALIETYTVTDTYVAVEQARGGRVAMPIDTLTGVMVEGDRVRITGTAGVLVLGFVRRRKALVKVLQTARPTLAVGTKIDAFCPT
jgi:hypothetical protein